MSAKEMFVGEGKRRKAAESGLVWHHTSILRTNLIWMSGVIELEGRSEGALHPAFGEIFTDATARRPLRDFPPLAWFTSKIEVPNCLQHFDMFGKDRTTGELIKIEVGPSGASALAMNRMALGFPVANVSVLPWPEHYGYSTGEGRALNSSAREVGDDPDDWWVSEKPVDVLEATAVRGSKSVLGVKLERLDGYLADVHRMVKLCRALPSTTIPPTWYGGEVHKALIAAGKDYRG